MLRCEEMSIDTGVDLVRADRQHGVLRLAASGDASVPRLGVLPKCGRGGVLKSDALIEVGRMAEEIVGHQLPSELIGTTMCSLLLVRGRESKPG